MYLLTQSPLADDLLGLYVQFNVGEVYCFFFLYLVIYLNDSPFRCCSCVCYDYHCYYDDNYDDDYNNINSNIKS